MGTHRNDGATSAGAAAPDWLPFASSGAFIRDDLPDWPAYADREGLTLIGRGRWRNTLCEFHDDTTPSMRVNIETGGWVCMSCGVKGGDTLSHYMQRSGLEFAAAARALGAWRYSGKATAHEKPRALAARDAMAVLSFELHVAFVVVSDVRAGRTPSNADWQRFLDGAARMHWLAEQFA